MISTSIEPHYLSCEAIEFGPMSLRGPEIGPLP